MFGVPLKYHNRATAGRRHNSTCRCKLVNIRTAADTTVYIITVVILNIDRRIVIRITFDGNITLITQINHLLINTIIHLEYLLCIQINVNGTIVNGSLQCIEMSIHIGMTYLQLVFRTVDNGRSFGFECPCTTIDTCKVFLNNSVLINYNVIFRIKVQTLLVRLDDKIVSFHPRRIIVYDTAADRRALGRYANNIHPSIEQCFSIVNGYPAFSHINLIHHLMVALTVNTDIPALTQFRRHTFERNLQFGIGKCIGRFIGREKIISGSRTFFFASIIPRSGAITGIYIFQSSYNNIGSRINVYPKCILRTRIELGQTDVEVGKYPFTRSAIQHKRYFIGIT